MPTITSYECNMRKCNMCGAQFLLGTRCYCGETKYRQDGTETLYIEKLTIEEEKEKDNFERML